jgi:hypothetical protein
MELATPDDPENYSSGSGRLSPGDLNNDMLTDIALIHKGVQLAFRHPGPTLAFDDFVTLSAPLKSCPLSASLAKLAVRL